MPFGVILLVIEIAFAVHVVRTGRQMMWLWIILFVPAIGCAIYFLAEILPELSGSRTARHTVARLDKTLNAGRDFQRLVAAVEDIPTADNKRALAEALLARNDVVGAMDLYHSALAPPHESDPVLLMGLARCQFAKGDATAALASLDRLLAANPGYQSLEGQLLYARCLEGAGRVEEALAEYGQLLPVFPGEEVRGRYGQLLRRLGRGPEAEEIFRSIIRSVDRAGGRYRQLYGEWYDLAKQEVGR